MTSEGERFWKENWQVPNDSVCACMGLTVNSGAVGVGIERGLRGD